MEIFTSTETMVDGVEEPQRIVKNGHLQGEIREYRMIFLRKTRNFKKNSFKFYKFFLELGMLQEKIVKNCILKRKFFILFAT